MNRLRFGTKEILATIGGCAAVVFLQWLEMYFMRKSVLPAEAYHWVQLRVPVVAAIAVFFGPISGVLCGLGGELLVSTLFDPFLGYPEVLALGLYGFFVGLYYGKLHYDIRHFSPRDFMDFNAVSIIVGLFCSMFFIPLAKFLVDNGDIYDSIAYGAKSIVGNSVVVGIMVPILMGLVSYIYGLHRRRGIT